MLCKPPLLVKVQLSENGCDIATLALVKQLRQYTKTRMLIKINIRVFASCITPMALTTWHSVEHTPFLLCTIL